MYGRGVRAVNLGTRDGFCCVGATVCDLLGVGYGLAGRSFAPEITDRQSGTSEDLREKLIARADDARKKAYCPYSGVSVGAALLCADGRIFTGCNIENAAFSPSICAERSAFASAVSAGVRDFTAIAVRGGKGEKPDACFPPCGVCRQVMAEFCAPDFEVILSKDEIKTLGELIPSAFSKDSV